MTRDASDSDPSATDMMLPMRLIHLTQRIFPMRLIHPIQRMFDSTDSSDASDSSDSVDTSDPSDAPLCDISGFGAGEVSLDNSLPSFLGAYKVRESPVEPGRFEVLSVQIYPEAPYNGQLRLGRLNLMVVITPIAGFAYWSGWVAQQFG